MPIKPENKKYYRGKTWQYFRAWALERAEDKCEFCGVENHALGVRDLDGDFHKGSFWDTVAGDPEFFGDDAKEIKIVLTVAHLDHGHENNGPDNLRALCQKCHLNHDQEQHQKNAAETRKKKNDAKRPLLEGQ